MTLYIRMGSSGFRLWIEADEQSKPVVFLDLDETLVHKIEVGWLRGSPSNDNYARLLVLGSPPYEDVVKIKNDGNKMHIFPRPGLTHFLEEVSKFAHLCILTHHKGDYAEKVTEELKIHKYFRGVYKTGKQKPGSLSREYDLLVRPWVLVDNLPLDSIEVINKMRILGLGHPDLSPKDEAERIIVKGRNHFVQVADWIPTAEEYNDYDLWRILPKIKHLVGSADHKE